jgi:hypothetical protein
MQSDVQNYSTLPIAQKQTIDLDTTSTTRQKPMRHLHLSLDFSGVKNFSYILL